MTDLFVQLYILYFYVYLYISLKAQSSAANFQCQVIVTIWPVYADLNQFWFLGVLIKWAQFHGFCPAGQNWLI